MSLVIVGVRDIGNFEKERAVFSATADSFLGKKIVVGVGDSLKDGSFQIDGGFWFPNEDVKKGDTVVLYTKGGSPKKKDHSSGRTSHFYYFGKSKPFWGEPILALLDVDSWSHHSSLISDSEEIE